MRSATALRSLRMLSDSIYARGRRGSPGLGGRLGLALLGGLVLVLTDGGGRRFVGLGVRGQEADRGLAGADDAHVAILVLIEVEGDAVGEGRAIGQGVCHVGRQGCVGGAEQSVYYVVQWRGVGCAGDWSGGGVA